MQQKNSDEAKLTQLTDTPLKFFHLADSLYKICKLKEN